MELYEGVRMSVGKNAHKYLNNSIHSFGEEIVRNITKFYMYRQIGSP